MAPRRRQRRKKMVGNTRLDAALDAMRPFGFKERLVEDTIEELLEVYEGSQGWPFIEEASYKLLIETILGKPQSYAEEKESSQDDARRDGVTEASSTATPATGLTEVCSSKLVAPDAVLQTTEIAEVGSAGPAAQDTVLQTTEIAEVSPAGPVAQNSSLCASDVLDSASQTNDHDPDAFGNLESDVLDTTLPTEKGGHKQGITVDSKNELKPVDNVNGSNDNMFVSNAESTFVKTHIIESSKAVDKPPYRRREPCYGWIDDSDEDVKLNEFPIPPLAKRLEKFMGLSGGRRRRKSRWDEKPDDI